MPATAQLIETPIRLTAEDTARAERLAKSRNITVADFVVDAVLEKIEDAEDIADYIAYKQLEKLGKVQTYSLSEVEAEIKAA